jgi:hypothetical protein
MAVVGIEARRFSKDIQMIGDTEVTHGTNTRRIRVFQKTAETHMMNDISRATKVNLKNRCNTSLSSLSSHQRQTVMQIEDTMTIQIEGTEKM